ncbi:MAG: EscI/YscI/HrpB family type III secretion system inner rod protein, partial [Roseibium sp.]|uniref:EscI/YscI/HrpB family type III secretion system inner rod protein n=2 Tax=Roseibium sp. TaxID=1936156 RepID=UPI003299711F
ALAVEKNRALRGLDLEKSVQGTEAASSVHDSRGDTILDGLSRLRSTFDDQTARLGNISSQSMSGTEMLIATQVEVVKYSLLMDVTSKLTGKSTQTFDTLMKGQ